jgi:dCMP deaminase
MKELKFKGILKEIALMSKDRNTKVGAIALDENLNIISTGYNGFPRGVNDNIDQRHQRPDKYLWTAHAEENLVAQAAYMGKSLKNSTILVSSLFACNVCARMIIQSGVKRIIAPSSDEGNWKESNETAITMFQEANVEIIFTDLLSKKTLFS